MMMAGILLVFSTLMAMSYGRMGGFIAGGFRINPGFSCEGRLYGFYADVDNDCRAYHVCEPVEDETGTVVETAHYTFMCGQDTVFDQQLMLCGHRDEAFPCSNAASIYDETNLQLRQEIEAKEKEAKLKKAITVVAN
ncbi:uncharacterized protein [Macrobrachium rosenbergii]|uniref:uncharacterized protein n=1 Tax=Macrobrachium rosenbergii TaxID=79674 RepID=UPI0034D5677E